MQNKNWLDAYNDKTLTLDMELSTFCNAKCPQCSRTDRWNNLQKKAWLPTENVSVKQFAKWLPPEDLNHIKNVHFSGTYGDPGMCKDLYKITEYVLTSSTCNVSINTNASMRDELFWWKLGAMAGERLHVIMDVDGINQEMHSFYRQNTNLKTVLNNLEAITETNCNVTVLTVLFEHNQNYLEEIRDMCRKLGVTQFDEVEGNNFGHNPIYEFYDMDGNKQELKQITRKDREQGLKRLDRRVRDHRHSKNKSTDKKEYDNIENWRHYDEIYCLALAQNNLKVSVRGTLTPCCYLSSGIETYGVYKSEKYPYQHLTPSGEAIDGLHPIMTEYMSRLKEKKMDLENKSIKKILASHWWTTQLPESWKDKAHVMFPQEHGLTAVWGAVSPQYIKDGITNEHGSGATVLAGEKEWLINKPFIPLPISNIKRPIYGCAKICGRKCG